MPVDRKPIFDETRMLLKKHAPGWVTYTPEEVRSMDRAIDQAMSSLASPTAPVEAVASQFRLGTKSMDELAPVHPKLRACVQLAITYSTVDFRVNQGLRSLADQKKAVASGNSRTMKSKHLKQPDGYVWAVDLVVLHNGLVSWEFKLYAEIALAMDKAATELGIADHIRWGCAWDRVLSDFNGNAPAYLAEAKAYAARHAGSDLLDGPHFEWVS
jgi:peptidoglycan L-alanyl-D-glutamate endopeptidase CwlK